MKRFLIALLLTVASAGISNAATAVCIGPSYSVPDRPFDPPHWWDAVSQPAYYNKVDDPRWIGSTKIEYTGGVKPDATFRALGGASDGFVYFSWQVNILAGDEKHLYFAYEQPGAAGPIYIHVTHTGASSVTDAWGGNDGAADAFTVNGSGVATPTALPAFVNTFTRVWRDSAALNWAVLVRIPKAQMKVDGVGNFNFWFSAFAGLPGATGTQYAFPRTAIVTDTNNDFIPEFPLLATWQPFLFVTNVYSGTPACRSSGVYLDVTGIGTRNSPSSQINRGVVNTFFAKPRNNTAGALPAGQITARFRMANWGSATPVQNGSWIDIPGGNTVPSAGPIAAGGGLPSDTDDIHFNWTPPGADASLSTHQCIYVELSSTAGVLFSNDSVYRNMDFDHASVFQRDAEISIKGLTTIAPDGRDVYLWIETRNMPKDNPQPYPSTVKTIIPPKEPRVVNSGNFSVSDFRYLVPGDPTPGPDVAIKSAADLEKLYHDGQITTEMLEENIPTYRVHVFHDTGKKLKLGATARAVLEPQTSFGYYMFHDGELKGWEHELVPAGFALESLGENFYRIKKVPNDGVVKISTKITARDSSTSASPGGLAWWIWALIIILIILVLWLLLRRK